MWTQATLFGLSMKRRPAANAKKVNVGFRKNGVDLLGFEVKISGKADI